MEARRNLANKLRLYRQATKSQKVSARKSTELLNLSHILNTSRLILPDAVCPTIIHVGEIKSRQTWTLKCSKFFICLERFGLGRPLTTHNEGLIEANRLTFNLIHLNNTNIY